MGCRVWLLGRSMLAYEVYVNEVHLPRHNRVVNKAVRCHGASCYCGNSSAAVSYQTKSDTYLGKPSVPFLFLPIGSSVFDIRHLPLLETASPALDFGAVGAQSLYCISGGLSTELLMKLTALFTDSFHRDIRLLIHYSVFWFCGIASVGTAFRVQVHLHSLYSPWIWSFCFDKGRGRGLFGWALSPSDWPFV